MIEAKAQPGADDKALGPETPEDVAILYSWANLHGAKYRDFSASRREFRAQQRARIAEQQRQTELAAARDLEEAAQRELEEAQRLLDGTRMAEAAAAADAEAKLKAEEAVRRAEERAQQEKLEAQRREQSAEELRVMAEKARGEMFEARKRAEDQAARYAEFDAQYRAEAKVRPPSAVPGELADPYYYTGQVDPAYFAPTPGVRTAQAARVSTERRAYQFPMHTGSDEHDSGTVRAYRSSPAFAPSPVSDYRPATAADLNMLPTDSLAGQERLLEHLSPIRYGDATVTTPADDYYDGGDSTRMFVPDLTGIISPSARNSAARDLHIRPAARRAQIEDVRYDEAVPVRMFAPTPARRPSGSEIAPALPVPKVLGTPLAQGESGNGKAAILSDETHSRIEATPIKPSIQPDEIRPGLVVEAEERRPAAEPVADETQWRSMDRRSRSLRRRRDSLDKRARTARQPRPESPLPEEIAADNGDNNTQAVPPPWFVPSDMPAQQAAAAVSLRNGSTEDVSDKAGSAKRVYPGPSAEGRNGHGALLDQTAGPGQTNGLKPERSELVSQPAESGIRAPRDIPGRAKAGAAGFGQNEIEPSHFLRNGHPRAERYQELETLSAPRSTVGLTGLLQKNLPVHDDGARLILAEPSVSAENSYSALTPDTLQQSRERVASRWFALKGLMGSPVTDQAVLGNSYDTKSPALSVISLSGGVGKTSIVATMGRALSSLGEKVLLADTNTHGLLPYYFGARDLRPGTVRTFTPPAGSVDAPVLLVNYEGEGVSGNEAEQERILDDIDRRSEGTQRVLLDLNSSNLWLARRMARLNPWILVPIAPDMNSVLGTQTVERLFADVTDANGRPVKPFYVLNQFDPTLPLHLDVREVLRQFLGDRLLPIMIHRAHAVAEALAEGMTVIDYAPGSPVTEDYMKLAAWLRKLSAPVSSTAMQGARWSEQ